MFQCACGAVGECEKCMCDGSRTSEDKALFMDKDTLPVMKFKFTQANQDKGTIKKVGALQCAMEQFGQFTGLVHNSVMLFYVLKFVTVLGTRAHYIAMHTLYQLSYKVCLVAQLIESLRWNLVQILEQSQLYF